MDLAFLFIRTANVQEIGLVIDRPGMKTAVVEIKSSKIIRDEQTETVARLGHDIPNSELFFLSRDPEPKQFGGVWRERIGQIIAR